MFKVKHMRLLFSIFLFIILSSCSNNNLDSDEAVTYIEVYNYDEDTLVDTIEDEELIYNLVEKLDKASTHTTAFMDFELPDYKLIFKNGEKEVYEIGYYIEVMHLGIKGRYWKADEDLIYGVKLELPTD